MEHLVLFDGLCFGESFPTMDAVYAPWLRWLREGIAASERLAHGVV